MMMVEAVGSPSERSLEEFIREASAQPLPYQEEERLDAPGALADAEVRERLVRAHLRTVIDEAVAHRGFGVPTTELVRVGMRGLLLGADDFVPGSDLTFTAHVRGRIREEIRRTVFVYQSD